MAGGRPKIELNVLPENWKEEVLELYSKGASDVEIRVYLANIRIDNEHFSINLFDRLLDEEAEFCETIKRGRLLAQLWWEKKARTNLKNKTFNHALWYMNVRNRFRKDWNVEGKQEVQTSEKKDIQIGFTE